MAVERGVSVRRWLAPILLFLLLFGPGAALAQEGGAKQESRRDLKIEQVRFFQDGFFPYEVLKGNLFLYSESLIFDNTTWYPPMEPLVEDPTSVRVFEEAREQPVLKIQSVRSFPNRLNLLTLIMVGPGIADSMVADSPLHPSFGKTLEVLQLGAEDNAYNLAMALCWGDREWPERIRSQEQMDTVMESLKNGEYLYPGPSNGNGNPLDCMIPLIADLDWLQRATPERAEEATQRNRTLHMFFPPENQNWRSGVLLITDGTAFREGNLKELVDLLQRTNTPLYTVGLSFSREGNEGLSRLRNLYETGEGAGLAGKFTSVGNRAALSDALIQLQRRWTEDTYVVEYLSAFSGQRFNPLPKVEVRWHDNSYVTPPATVSPPAYLAWVRKSLWALTVASIIGLFLYILYLNQIWPFNPKLRVVTCPQGLHTIPDDWPRCRFCETEAAWGRLILLSGDRAGEVVYLREDTYSIGASAKDDIVLTQMPETTVQETHASLHWLRQGQKIVVQGRSGDVRMGDAVIPPGGANVDFGDIMEFGEGGVSAILLRGLTLVK